MDNKIQCTVEVTLNVWSFRGDRGPLLHITSLSFFSWFLSAIILPQMQHKIIKIVWLVSWGRFPCLIPPKTEKRKGLALGPVGYFCTPECADESVSGNVVHASWTTLTYNVHLHVFSVALILMQHRKFMSQWQTNHLFNAISQIIIISRMHFI